METSHVPNYDDDGTYLTRLRIVATPWFGVYIHRFDGPDPRLTLHDHPWNFTSLVLRGGYVERRLDPRTMEVNEAHRVRWVNRIRTHDFHAIVRLSRVPTWTLMLVGPRRRKWGYLEKDERFSWLWTAFDAHPHALEFDAALRRRAERS